MTKIKLCGLTRPEDIEAANGLMPDFVGFVFAEKSRRYVPPETAARLRERLNPEIPAAGVFVDAPPEHVAELLERGTIQIAQLHGQEDEAYIRALRALTDRTIWKAFKITAPGDLAAAAASSADLVLLDNGPGGTGESFDWALLRDFPGSKPQGEKTPKRWKNLSAPCGRRTGRRLYHDKPKRTLWHTRRAVHPGNPDERRH